MPPWKKSISDAYGYVGGMVNLTCEATAEPPANFSWSANNKKLTPKSHIIYNGRHVSMLQVRGWWRPHHGPLLLLIHFFLFLRFIQIMIKTSSIFGKYKCEAKNELGSVTQEIHLKEGTKPDPPSLVRI